MAIVHIINNEVSRAFVADGVLAYGGSPMMSENHMEFDAIHKHTGAMLINLGMVNPQKENVIIKACQSASKYGIPIGLDPVGIHISPWRLKVFEKIMSTFEIAYVKGNQDEVYCGVFGPYDGQNKSLEAVQRFELEQFSSRLLASKTVWLITGEQDYVVGRGRCEIVSGGTPDLRKISGAGCLLSALVAVNISKGMCVLNAAVKASCDLKKASEGFAQGGVGTLKVNIIDRLGQAGESSV
ncbi:MAG: hydroxyethylthiazole kinase [Clostridia bacterium]|nr:hydroxyethylthiazole kinase [Clostridia bacterium]